MRRAGVVLVSLVAISGGAWAQADLFRLPAGVKARVLLFTTIDCPISNRYAPEISRLYQTFIGQGIQFSLVFANPADTPGAIAAHVKTFGYTLPVVRDTAQTLVRRAGVTIAPEAAVIDNRGQVVYRGRIDDRYVSFGVDRVTPTRRDLYEALSAVVQGRAIAVAETHAIGCGTRRFHPASLDSREKHRPCHCPGFFSLASDDAARRGRGPKGPRYIDSWSLVPGFGPGPWSLVPGFWSLAFWSLVPDH